MAATLDDLLMLNGVVAAGEFTPDGKLVDYKAKASPSRRHRMTTSSPISSGPPR